MRRACLEAAALLRRQAKNLDILDHLQKRGFASLPEDISNAARQAKFPARRQPIGQPSPGAAAEAAAAGEGGASNQAAKTIPLDNAKEGAKIGMKERFEYLPLPPSRLLKILFILILHRSIALFSLQLPHGCFHGNVDN